MRVTYIFGMYDTPNSPSKVSDDCVDVTPPLLFLPGFATTFSRTFVFSLKIRDLSLLLENVY